MEERMATIAMAAGASGTLEGIYVLGASEGAPVRGGVVAPPHPLYGGSMDSPVVNEIAWACSSTGIASLRFNWRGVGASSGSASGEVADADADYAAALIHMEETVSGAIVACGYSFGAATALRAARRHARVKRLVLVAPPPSLLGPEGFAGVDRELLVLVGEADTLAPPAQLERALEGVAEASLEVVPGADHFFATGLAAVGREAGAWLRERGAG
jgi:alpha/beta superfamily hydrolase